MLTKKYFSQLSLIALILLLAATSPLKLVAQDDMSGDEEAVMPTSNSGTTPAIIDESDSGAVNDAEEYDG